MAVAVSPRGRIAAVACGVVLLITGRIASAAAQVEITLHGGVHAARLGRPERVLVQPARFISLQSDRGEATALGIRLGGPVTTRFGWDAGMVWSRNRSASGSFGGGTPPDFDNHTLFASATAQAMLIPPTGRLGLRLGAGPALIFHRGTGESLLNRQIDVGGMVTLSGQYSLDGRLALRLDAQEYLFNSSFREPYAGQFVGDPVQPAGSQSRHEFVILAGVAWSPR
jgi:hypothetical protein